MRKNVQNDLSNALLGCLLILSFSCIFCLKTSTEPEHQQKNKYPFNGKWVSADSMGGDYHVLMIDSPYVAAQWKWDLGETFLLWDHRGVYSCDSNTFSFVYSMDDSLLDTIDYEYVFQQQERQLKLIYRYSSNSFWDNLFDSICPFTKIDTVIQLESPKKNIKDKKIIGTWELYKETDENGVVIKGRVDSCWMSIRVYSSMQIAEIRPDNKWYEDRNMNNYDSNITTSPAFIYDSSDQQYFWDNSDSLYHHWSDSGSLFSSIGLPYWSTITFIGSDTLLEKRSVLGGKKEVEYRYWKKIDTKWSSLRDFLYCYSGE